jgi:FkbM family methyltransferase
MPETTATEQLDPQTIELAPGTPTEDKKTGIIYRHQSFDQFILNEARACYFPMGIKAGEVILDIGAHIGVFAARARLEQPDCTILSVEPQSDNFNILQLNSDKFGFDVLQAAVVPDRLNGKDIQLYVNTKKNNALHSTVPVRGRVTETVKGVSLTSLFEASNVDVLKVDCEGGEYEFDWQAALAVKKPRKIIMELHLTHKGHREEAPKLVALIQSLGYTPTKVPVFGEKNWTTIAAWELA